MKTIKISELKPAGYNPRKISKHDMNSLVNSIREFGFVEPVVVNKSKGRENVIIGGHQRIEAAKKLGMEEVPVIFVNLTKEKEKLLNLALNKIHGDWDEELLQKIIMEISGYDNANLSGFSDNDIEAILSDGLELKDVDAENVIPSAKLGDIYQLGKNRVMCGDSANREQLNALMDGKKADLIITDPPYNVNYDYSKVGIKEKSGKYGKGKNVFNDDKTDKEFTEFLASVFSNARMHLKDDGVVYCCYALGNYIQFRTGIESSGLKYMQTIIWLKDRFVFARGEDFHRQFEPIMFLKNGKHRYTNKRFSSMSDIWGKTPEEFASSLDVWYAEKDNNYQHPTQKPVKLIKNALLKSSEQGFIVMDLFGGSGTTLLACEQMNRVCYLMELDPKFVDVILSRWEELTGKKAVKVEATQKFCGNRRKKKQDMDAQSKRDDSPENC